MADAITKKDLEQHQKAIIEAVDFKFGKLEGQVRGLGGGIDQKFEQLEHRLDVFDQKLDKLTTALDNFLKQMSDYKEEFIILKGEVDKIKSFIKEKFGVEIAVQG